MRSPARPLACSLLAAALLLAPSRPAAAADDARLSDRATLRLDTGAHAGAVTCIAASSDGALIVTGSLDRTVRLWDGHSGELRRTLRPPSSPDGDEGQIWAVALSPDGRLVAAGGATRFFDARDDRSAAVYLFDASSGALIRRLPGAPLTGRSHHIDRIAFSRDGSRLAVTRGDHTSFGVYDVATGAASDVIPPEDRVGLFFDVDFDGQGRLLACRRQGHCQLYDAALRPLKVLDGLTGLRQARFSPDGKRVAMLYDDGRIELRQAATLKPLPPVATPPEPRAPATAFGWSSDGGSLLLVAAGVVRRIPVGPPARKQPRVAASEVAVPAVAALAALPDGAATFAGSDGSWGLLAADGSVQRFGGLPFVAAPPDALLVDETGEEVELRPDGTPSSRLRFNVAALELDPPPRPEDDARLHPPLTEPPSPHRLTGWRSPPVYLNDGAILGIPDQTTSLAVAPGGAAFTIGAARALFGFRFSRPPAGSSDEGCSYRPAPGTLTQPPCWVRPVASPVRAVNYSGDGRFLIALLADGTVRWYGAGDGIERLALLARPRPGDRRFVLYRPDGPYAASAGGGELVGWLRNPQSLSAATAAASLGADFVPLSRLAGLERPAELAAALRPEGRAAPAAPPPAPDALPPLLTILAPAEGAAVSGSMLSLRVAVRSPAGRPVTALHVRVDGRPVAITGGGGLAARGVVNLGSAEPAAAARPLPGNELLREETLTVPLAGRPSVVAVFAESQAGVGPPAVLHLRPAGAAPATTATLHLLGIGIGDYLRPDLRLRYPAKDARDLAALVERQGTGRLYRALDVRVLADREATRSAILVALDGLKERAGPDDTTILFLAGHGVNDPSTGEYQFLPVDADPGAGANLLAAAALRKTLAELPGRVVLLLDTCHAGNVLGRRPGRLSRGLPALTRAVAELANVDSGIIVMTAATGSQASVEDTAWQNGAFTKALLEGLGGRADLRRTGRVTVNMLDLYVSERVRELTAGSQTPATAKPVTVADFPLLLHR